MKYKITSLERSVGIFLLFCALGMMSVGVVVFSNNLFWKEKVSFNLKLNSAGQLQEGSKVQLKGMTIGNVVNVKLNEEAEVIAKLEVIKDYHKFFTTVSEVHIVNPTIIGEKIVELKYVPASTLVGVGSFLPVVEGDDLINKLSSIDFKDITPILASLKGTLTKTDSIAKKINGHLPKVLAQTDKLSSETVVALQNTNKLIVDLQETAPLLKTVAKDMPAVSEKSIKAINEAIVVLKAMQKSFFLRGNAEEVKQEIANEESSQAKTRMPASEK